MNKLHILDPSGKERRDRIRRLIDYVLSHNPDELTIVMRIAEVEVGVASTYEDNAHAFFDLSCGMDVIKELGLDETQKEETNEN